LVALTGIFDFYSLESINADGSATMLAREIYHEK
jgi:hypothetical protein